MQFLVLLIVLTVLVFCLTAVTVLFFFQTFKDLAIDTVVGVVGLVVVAKELKTFLVIGTLLGLFEDFLTTVADCLPVVVVGTLGGIRLNETFGHCSVFRIVVGFCAFAEFD